MSDFIIPFIAGILFALAVVELATTIALRRMFPRYVGGRVLKSGVYEAYRFLKKLVQCHKLLATLNFAANAFVLKSGHTNTTQAFVEMVRAATGGTCK